MATQIKLSTRLMELFQNCHDVETAWVLLFELFTGDFTEEVLYPSEVVDPDIVPVGVAERIEEAFTKSSPEEVVEVLQRHWVEIDGYCSPEISIMGVLLLYMSLPDPVYQAIAEYAKGLAAPIIQGIQKQSDLELWVEDLAFIPGMKEVFTAKKIQLAEILEDLRQLLEVGEEEYWRP